MKAGKMFSLITRAFNLLLIICIAFLCAGCRNVSTSTEAATEGELQSAEPSETGGSENQNKMDLTNEDFVIHRVYYDSARYGFCFYIWEPLEGQEGWNDTKSFRVYVTDDDLNVLYEKTWRADMFNQGAVEYYRTGYGIYEVFCDGSDDFLTFEWNCVWGESNKLGSTGSMHVSCSSEQDFDGLADAMSLLMEMENSSDCMLRLGKEYYDTENVSGDISIVESMFEKLDLAYFTEETPGADTLVRALETYLSSRNVPEKYADVYSWIMNLRCMEDADWVWVTANEEELSGNFDEIYAAVSSGMEQLCDGDQSGFCVIKEDEQYELSFDIAHDENTVFTCTTDKPSDSFGSSLYKVSLSQKFDFSNVNPKRLAAIVMKGLEYNKESYCFLGELEDDSLQDAVFVDIADDAQGYKYIREYAVGLFDSGDTFVYLSGDIFENADILENGCEIFKMRIESSELPDQFVKLIRVI